MLFGIWRTLGSAQIVPGFDVSICTRLWSDLTRRSQQADLTKLDAVLSVANHLCTQVQDNLHKYTNVDATEKTIRSP